MTLKYILMKSSDSKKEVLSTYINKESKEMERKKDLIGNPDSKKELLKLQRRQQMG